MTSACPKGSGGYWELGTVNYPRLKHVGLYSNVQLNKKIGGWQFIPQLKHVGFLAKIFMSIPKTSIDKSWNRVWVGKMPCGGGRKYKRSKNALWKGADLLLVSDKSWNSLHMLEWSYEMVKPMEKV